MKKILIHINSLGKGGAERVVSLLAGFFAKDGYQVVLATEWVEKEEYPLPEAVRRVHVGLKQEEENGSRLAKQWKRVSRLRKVIKEEQPAVVLAFCVKANYRAMLASFGCKAPVVVCVRNDPRVDYVGRAKWLANKLLMNRAAGAVFQTEEARDFFASKLQKKSVIIWNPVAEKYLEASLKEQAVKRIVTVGRISAQKNHRLLAEAFELFCREYPDYRLDIYGADSGDGSKERLDRFLKARRLTGKIHFLGTSSSLERDMADAAMFVLSSDYEGMPNALMEAMAMGLPVISTDCPCGGSRFWIEPEKNGLLVPTGEAAALAEAMKRLAQDDALRRRLGKNARETLQKAKAEEVYLRWKNWLTCDIMK